MIKDLMMHGYSPARGLKNGPHRLNTVRNEGGLRRARERLRAEVFGINQPKTHKFCVSLALLLV